jgi:hypothetical protein
MNPVYSLTRPISLRSVLLRPPLSLRGDLFPSSFPIRILYTILVSPLLDTCLAPLGLLNLSTPIIREPVSHLDSNRAPVKCLGFYLKANDPALLAQCYLREGGFRFCDGLIRHLISLTACLKGSIFRSTPIRGKDRTLLLYNKSI